MLAHQRNKRYTGAVYLGGYVVECLLKAAICVEQRTERLPARYRTHDLEELLAVTGYERDMPPQLHAKFQRLTAWGVLLRYQGKAFDAQVAREFLANVEVIRRWLLERMSR